MLILLLTCLIVVAVCVYGKINVLCSKVIVISAGFKVTYS